MAVYALQSSKMSMYIKPILFFNTLLDMADVKYLYDTKMELKKQFIKVVLPYKKLA